MLKVRLTDAEREHLQRVARENNCTPTDVVRDATNSYCVDYSDQVLFPGGSVR